MTNEQHKACFGEPGMKDRYAFVSNFYDLTSNLYSGKSIQRCKIALPDHELLLVRARSKAGVIGE